MRRLTGAGVFIVGVALALVAGAQPASYSWIQGQTAYGEDLSVTYDGAGKVITMTVLSAEGVRLTGDAAVQFADGAKVVALAGGELAFDVPVTGEGGVAFYVQNISQVYDATATSRGFLPATEADAVVIARCADLSTFDVVAAHFNPKGQGVNWIYSSTTGMAYHVTRGVGAAEGDARSDYNYHYSCQIQGADEPDCGATRYSRCVFLEIRQQGDDLIAWTPTTCHWGVADVGKDFTSVIPQYEHPVSCVSPRQEGYGLGRLSLASSVQVRPFTVAVMKSFEVIGVIDVGVSVTFSAQGAKALTSGEEWNGKLRLGGRGVIRNRNGLTLTGTIDYVGEGEMEIVADAERSLACDEMNLPDYIGTSWYSLGVDVPATAMSEVFGSSKGGWISEAPWQMRHLKYPTSTNALCQLLRADGKFVKGILFELWQSADGTKCRVIGSASKQYADNPTAVANLDNVDFSNASEAVATGPNESGYGLIKAKVIFGVKPPYRMDVNLLAPVSGANARLHIRGSTNEQVLVSAFTNTAVPAVSVHQNGVFRYAGNNNSYVLTDCEHFVGWGGQYWQGGEWTIPFGVSLCVSGGVFSVAHDNAAPCSTVASVYLNTVTFKDGGRIADHGFITGYYKDPSWMVRGLYPAVIEGGINFAGNPSKTQITARFDVDEVTGNEDPDLTIGGALSYYNKGWNNVQIEKSGAGTLRTMAANVVTTFPLLVKGGLWQFGTSGCSTADNGLEMAGGGIGQLAGCTNAFGTVIVAERTAQRIVLGDDSELTFSTFAAGSGSCVSVETASASARLRILATTPESLRRMRVNGQRACLDENGFVYGQTPGLMLIVR